MQTLILFTEQKPRIASVIEQTEPQWIRVRVQLRQMLPKRVKASVRQRRLVQQRRLVNLRKRHRTNDR